MEGHSRKRRVARGLGVIRQEKAPASEVDQPLPVTAALEHPVGETVRLEVVRLGVVHGDEQRRRRGTPGRTDSGSHGRGAERTHEFSPLHDFGIAPRA